MKIEKFQQRLQKYEGKKEVPAGFLLETKMILEKAQKAIRSSEGIQKPLQTLIRRIRLFLSRVEKVVASHVSHQLKNFCTEHHIKTVLVIDGNYRPKYVRYMGR